MNKASDRPPMEPNQYRDNEESPNMTDGAEPPVSLKVIAESFGYLHHPAPLVHLTIDLRTLLYDPDIDPALRELTGRYPEVRQRVLDTPCARGIVTSLIPIVTELVCIADTPRCIGGPATVAFGCSGGRHCSVVLAEELAATLNAAGIPAKATHRDIYLPVVQRERCGQ